MKMAKAKCLWRRRFSRRSLLNVAPWRCQRVETPRNTWKTTKSISKPSKTMEKPEKKKKKKKKKNENPPKTHGKPWPTPRTAAPTSQLRLRQPRRDPRPDPPHRGGVQRLAVGRGVKGRPHGVHPGLPQALHQGVMEGLHPSGRHGEGCEASKRLEKVWNMRFCRVLCGFHEFFNAEKVRFYMVFQCFI